VAPYTSQLWIDQTQEHVCTHLFEGLLQLRAVIVSTSRPIISCTAVLHLSTHGVSGGESGVTTFNGPVDDSASAKVPPRCSKTSDSQSSSSSASAEFESSENLSDVAAKVVPNRRCRYSICAAFTENGAHHSTTQATFRSRLGSLNMSIDEAAVGDVS
jgi:hypothetical protein